MKRTIKWYMWMLMLITALAAGGCGWRPSGDTISTNIATFYQPGRVWTYETSQTAGSTPETYTVKVIGTEQYHGYNVLRVDTAFADESNQMRQYMRFVGGAGVILGIDEVDAVGSIVSSQSYLPGVAFPALLAPGPPMKSEYHTDNGAVIWTVETQILGISKESVTVPAGTYPSAIKAHSRVTTTRKALDTQNTDTVVLEEYTWYDPHVGMVKSQTIEGAQTTRLMKVEQSK